MKLFIDTNIFLDLLLNRGHVDSSKQIIQFIVDGRYEGFISDITLLNIDYIAKKQIVDIRSFLQFVSDNFTVLGASNKEINKAISLSNSDFEDNVQYFLAKKVDCDIIISNDKGFVSEELELCLSNDFIQKYHV